MCRQSSHGGGQTQVQAVDRFIHAVATAEEARSLRSSEWRAAGASAATEGTTASTRGFP